MLDLICLVNFSSLTTYNSNALVILVAAALIIIGGLGFTVWNELYNCKKFKKVFSTFKNGYY